MLAKDEHKNSNIEWYGQNENKKYVSIKIYNVLVSSVTDSKETDDQIIRGKASKAIRFHKLLTSASSEHRVKIVNQFKTKFSLGDNPIDAMNYHSCYPPNIVYIPYSTIQVEKSDGCDPIYAIKVVNFMNLLCRYMPSLVYRNVCHVIFYTNDKVLTLAINDTINIAMLKNLIVFVLLQS